ncbi:SRPBCC family protein [Saccharothrix obliqua]|uniref:SRPBCC family protein n=1 Tax=Saccharothrix obliqua TaxID=2861747 RepID=UPI001C5E1377|nr:SRPBCC family protein [Saccharothrix obliqua]MBW4720333.1 SRPBCC family protein [Saccharothrix obliqua]
MVEVSAVVPTTADRVFDVLADGWSYVGWVVGAAHIREVDPGWPDKGTRIHHSVGPWPLLVHDVTTVREVERPRLLELEARLWPFGAALVRLELTEDEPNSTRITMTERATRGPGVVLPEAVQALLLVPRNRESLRRLADLAVGKDTREV